MVGATPAGVDVSTVVPCGVVVTCAPGVDTTVPSGLVVTCAPGVVICVAPSGVVVTLVLFGSAVPVAGATPPSVGGTAVASTGAVAAGAVVAGAPSVAGTTGAVAAESAGISVVSVLVVGVELPMTTAMMIAATTAMAATMIMRFLFLVGVDMEILTRMVTVEFCGEATTVMLLNFVRVNIKMPQPETANENMMPIGSGAAGWRARPLVLVGLMGAGKSTVGHRLAAKLGRSFIDSDDEIVAAAGCSIADIFATHGEPIFRDLEKRVIARLLAGEPIVLATGGGAWMQPAVREIIRAKGTSLWLRAELDVLLDRVSRRDHRPLLETGDKRTILTKLMEERYPEYATADITIDSGRGPHDKVVEHILRTLEQIS